MSESPTWHCEYCGKVVMDFRRDNGKERVREYWLDGDDNYICAACVKRYNLTVGARHD